MSSNHAVFFIGPAGTGKSSLCTAMLEHFEAIKRKAHLVNLDPAAILPKYRPSFDIKDHISVEEVMDQNDCGPNGGLLLSLEKALDSESGLREDLENREDDFLLVDCPGQIEIYTHTDILEKIIGIFIQNSYRVCVVYLLEAHFVLEPTKFIAGVLNALSAMMNLETPHLNVISKVDLLEENSLGEIGKSNEEDGEDGEDGGGDTSGDEDAFFEDVEDGSSRFSPYFYPDSAYLLESIDKKTPSKYKKLNKALVDLMDEYQLVNFLPVSVKNKKSIEHLVLHMDNCLQYGEDTETKETDRE
ncbi:MAG: ATP(GTP)-binding protein Fet5 [Amphiamblys sp. WSBS2006]|nr:MAG: ATP(GTP)-binding protein Fet5 [Amphiamblys sp. WSBS2006]